MALSSQLRRHDIKRTLGSIGKFGKTGSTLITRMILIARFSQLNKTKGFPFSGGILLGDASELNSND
jgi:hypothetical protein